MSIWIGNIILLFFYSVIINNKTMTYKQSKTSLLAVIMFIQLLLLYVFNDNTIFPDTRYYLKGFDYSLTVGWNDVPKIQHFSTEIKFDLGWCYFTKLLSSLFNHNLILLFAAGFIFILSYFTVIMKYSLIPWLSIFLFIATVFYSSLFILRQSMAVAICLFSIPYIIERKFLKFLFFIFIAFSFHKTALIFVLLYFLYPLKIDKNFFFPVIIMGLLFYSGFKFILHFSATYLPGFAIYDSNIFKMANYTSFSIALCIFVFIVICYYPFSQIENYTRLFFQMLLLFFMVELFRIGIPGTMGRLNLYFYIAVILLLPNAIQQISNINFKYISVIVIIVIYFTLMIKQMNYGFNLLLKI